MLTLLGGFPYPLTSLVELDLNLLILTNLIFLKDWRLNLQWSAIWGGLSSCSFLNFELIPRPSEKNRGQGLFHKAFLGCLLGRLLISSFFWWCWSWNTRPSTYRQALEHWFTALARGLPYWINASSQASVLLCCPLASVPQGKQFCPHALSFRKSDAARIWREAAKAKGSDDDAFF